MTILATIFWLIVCALCAIFAAMQFFAAQDRADRGNLAGLLWEAVLFVAAVKAMFETWPF